MSRPRLLYIAKEWANELGKPEFKGHELLVAEIAAWGFKEVLDRGRNPDAVLKDMLAKIADGIGEKKPLLN